MVRLVTKGVCIPHPWKAHYGGEDAHIIDEKQQLVVFSDGVGGYDKEVETQIADYSNALVAKVADECRTGATLKQAIHRAHLAVDIPGAATICIVQKETDDDVLSVANLGDCRVVLFRNGEAIWSSQVQQHGFNCPLQLGHPLHHPCSDTAEVAEFFELEVQEGDVLLMGTDGLWDNVWVAELQQMLPASSSSLDECAARIAHLAFHHSMDESFISPFAMEAAQHSVGFDRGGKPDDITVLVAVIASDDHNPDQGTPAAETGPAAASLTAKATQDNRQGDLSPTEKEVPGLTGNLAEVFMDAVQEHSGYDAAIGVGGPAATGASVADCAVNAPAARPQAAGTRPTCITPLQERDLNVNAGQIPAKIGSEFVELNYTGCSASLAGDVTSAKLNVSGDVYGLQPDVSAIQAAAQLAMLLSGTPLPQPCIAGLPDGSNAGSLNMQQVDSKENMPSGAAWCPQVVWCPTFVKGGVVLLAWVELGDAQWLACTQLPNGSYWPVSQDRDAELRWWMPGEALPVLNGTSEQPTGDVHTTAVASPDNSGAEAAAGAVEHAATPAPHTAAAEAAAETVGHDVALTACTAGAECAALVQDVGPASTAAVPVAGSVATGEAGGATPTADPAAAILQEDDHNNTATTRAAGADKDVLTATCVHAARQQGCSRQSGGVAGGEPSGSNAAVSAVAIAGCDEVDGVQADETEKFRVQQDAGLEWNCMAQQEEELAAWNSALAAQQDGHPSDMPAVNTLLSAAYADQADRPALSDATLPQSAVLGTQQLGNTEGHTSAHPTDVLDANISEVNGAVELELDERRGGGCGEGSAPGLDATGQLDQAGPAVDAEAAPADAALRCLGPQVGCIMEVNGVLTTAALSDQLQAGGPADPAATHDMEGVGAAAVDAREITALGAEPADAQEIKALGAEPADAQEIKALGAEPADAQEVKALGAEPSAAQEITVHLLDSRESDCQAYTRAHPHMAVHDGCIEDVCSGTPAAARHAAQGLQPSVGLGSAHRQADALLGGNGEVQLGDFDNAQPVGAECANVTLCTESTALAGRVEAIAEPDQCNFPVSNEFFLACIDVELEPVLDRTTEVFGLTPGNAVQMQAESLLGITNAAVNDLGFGSTGHGVAVPSAGAEVTSLGSEVAKYSAQSPALCNLLGSSSTAQDKAAGAVVEDTGAVSIRDETLAFGMQGSAIAEHPHSEEARPMWGTGAGGVYVQGGVGDAMDNYRHGMAAEEKLARRRFTGIDEPSVKYGASSHPCSPLGMKSGHSPACSPSRCGRIAAHWGPEGAELGCLSPQSLCFGTWTQDELLSCIMQPA